MIADAEFIERLKTGDEQAFAELVRHYHRQLTHVARGICGEAFCEEVVQEAWLSIHRNLPNFEGRSSLKTWIYTIVGNGAKTRLRKESRHVSLEDVEGTMSGIDESNFNSDGHWTAPPPDWNIDSPEQLLEESDLQDCIDKTLSKLPDSQRAVFTLRELEQESLDEVRNILDLGDSNVRVLLHRARIKLMQVIDRYQETGKC